MLRIRLRRMGAKKQPSYRVVVADRRTPRDGKFVEVIGHYNPRTDPVTFRINEERALYWLSQGAQPSDSVERLLRRGGTLDRFARLRAGEPLEALLAEAEQQKAQADIQKAEEAEAEETKEETKEEEIEGEEPAAEGEDTPKTKEETGLMEEP